MQEGDSSHKGVMSRPNRRVVSLNFSPEFFKGGPCSNRGGGGGLALSICVFLSPRWRCVVCVWEKNESCRIATDRLDTNKKIRKGVRCCCEGFIFTSSHVMETGISNLASSFNNSTRWDFEHPTPHHPTWRHNVSIRARADLARMTTCPKLKP